MKYTFLRYIMSVLVGLSLALPLIGFSQLIHIPFAHAQEGYSEEYGQKTGFIANVDLTSASGLVRVFIAFIGMLFVITTFMGAVRLVVAGDNAEDKGKAKQLLASGIIGLGVVFSAYIIVTYIITALSQRSL